MANNPLFMDSFDHYTSGSDLSSKWSQVGVHQSVQSGGRYQNCLHVALGDGGVYKNLPSLTYSELTVGFGFKFASFPISGWRNIVFFSDNGVAQTILQLSSSGQLGIFTGAGTLICQSITAVLTNNTWHHIKFNAAFATGATGHCSVKLNSIEVCSATGVQTSYTTANANQLQLTGSGGIDMFFDDVWVIDPTVTDESLYGDQIVIYCGANGAGQTTDWTPSAGTNYQNVDDNPPTDASYNAAANVDDVDLYACQDLPGTVTGVVAVQVVNRLRKDDANPVSVAPVVGDGTESTTGTAVSLAQDYGFYLQGWGTNPNNADADWTPSDVNALQVGAKRTV